MKRLRVVSSLSALDLYSFDEWWFAYFQTLGSNFWILHCSEANHIIQTNKKKASTWIIKKITGMDNYNNVLVMVKLFFFARHSVLFSTSISFKTNNMFREGSWFLKKHNYSCPSIYMVFFFWPDPCICLIESNFKDWSRVRELLK